MIGLSQSPLSAYLFASVGSEESNAYVAGQHHPHKCIVFREFVEWIVIVVCGDEQAKLRMGFKLLDSSGCGSVGYDGITQHVSEGLIFPSSYCR